MGASANQIERQIEETRHRMDENLNELEDRAASNARRYGRIAAVAIGALALIGAGLLVYRRTRKPALQKKFMDHVSMGSLRDFAGDLRSRVKKTIPSVTLTINERSEEPGAVESIVRKVAPAIVGTASTALLDRVTLAGAGGDRRRTQRAD